MLKEKRYDWIVRYYPDDIRGIEYEHMYGTENDVALFALHLQRCNPERNGNGIEFYQLKGTAQHTGHVCRP